MNTNNLPAIYYEFREPRDIVELEQMFKTRYAIYINTEMESFLTKNHAELDLDSYDNYSIPFVLFKYENGQKSIAGSARCIFDSPQKYENDIKTVAKKYNVSELVDEPPPYYFPSMEINEQFKNAIFDFKEKIKKEKKELIEVSRFMISKEERNNRIAFIYLEMLYAYFPKHISPYNQCRVSHASSHRRLLGAELFPKTSHFKKPNYETDWNILFFNTDNSASFIVERNPILREAFSKFGHIIWIAESPNSFFVKDGNNGLMQVY